MNSIAETAPGADRKRSWSLRTYLAGGTATSALIAGAVIVFVSLATFVAFKGFSDGKDGGGDDGAVVVGAQGAPEAAAAAVGRAPGAVAATPAAPTAVAPTGAAPATGAAGTTPVTGTQAAGDSGSVDGGAVTQTPTDPTAPAGSGSTGSGGGGPLDNAVSGVENTTSDLGVDADLGGLHNVTQQLDQTVNDTLNNVGGVLGNPNLGNQVSSGVNNVTSPVLGQGGLTDQLLGGN